MPKEIGTLYMIFANETEYGENYEEVNLDLEPCGLAGLNYSDQAEISIKGIDEY
jgi:hypothetical protein